MRQERRKLMKYTYFHDSAMNTYLFNEFGEKLYIPFK